jgi:hypothetical protein
MSLILKKRKELDLISYTDMENTNTLYLIPKTSIFSKIPTQLSLLRASSLTAANPHHY